MHIYSENATKLSTSIILQFKERILNESEIQRFIIRD